MQLPRVDRQQQFHVKNSILVLFTFYFQLVAGTSLELE